MASISLPCKSRLGGGFSSCSPEHGTRHQSGPARIAEVEQPSDNLSGGKEARNRFAGGVDDLSGFRYDRQTAKGEGHATTHLIGLEWRLVDRLCPVRFIDGE